MVRIVRILLAFTIMARFAAAEFVLEDTVMTSAGKIVGYQSGSIHTYKGHTVC